LAKAVEFPEIVNGATLAHLLGVTEKRVQQLVIEGAIDRAGKGKYETVACIRGYIATLKTEKKGVGLEIANADLRLKNLKADEQEMANREQAGELARKEDYAFTWSQLVIACKSILLALPQMWRVQAGLSPEQAKVCRAGILGALEELSEWTGEDDGTAVAGGAASGAATEAAAEDGRGRVG